MNRRNYDEHERVKGELVKALGLSTERTWAWDHDGAYALLGTDDAGCLVGSRQQDQLPRRVAKR